MTYFPCLSWGEEGTVASPGLMSPDLSIENKQGLQYLSSHC